MEQDMHVALQWLSDNQATILSVLAILVGAWVLKRFGDVIIRRSVRGAVKSTAYGSRSAEKKREDTIIHIISGALNILIWPLAIMVAISQLGVNIAPLIAGAGILGVALGFGAQSLVKDVISGLFIIMENQYRVGDVVQLGETAGIVERISLRVTVLRDLDGIVHHVPNGTIDQTSNYTMDYSGINLNVTVSYSSDLDEVIKVVNKVGSDLAKDKDWAEKIKEKPEFLRVDNFAENGIEMKILGTVEPLMQWEVTGELRKRIKIAFDKNGIEIPLPQRVIHQSKK